MVLSFVESKNEKCLTCPCQWNTVVTMNLKMYLVNKKAENKYVIGDFYQETKGSFLKKITCKSYKQYYNTSANRSCWQWSKDIFWAIRCSLFFKILTFFGIISENFFHCFMKFSKSSHQVALSSLFTF